MKRHIIFFISLLSLFVWTGCASQKGIAYMQNSETVDLSKSGGLYDLRIIPQDELDISVVFRDEEVSKAFNKQMSFLKSVTRSSVDVQEDSTSENQSNLADPYIVDMNGNIEFPIIGQLHIVGLTENGVKNIIKKKLASYFAKITTEQPIITCRILNYTISVLGEVKRPGTYKIANEKVNILEALAISGDLTIYGKRNNLNLLYS